MIDDTTGQEPVERPLRSSFDRYLQEKGKGRGGDGGNYRRNAVLDRVQEWAAGDCGDDDWTGVVPIDGARRVLKGVTERRLSASIIRTATMSLPTWADWVWTR